MEDNRKVIAVVVTYNRKELLRESIEALINQEYDNCEILVVDNASTDGTKEYIEDLLENNRIHYENTGANLGGAGGFNYGMKKACHMECDFIWLMDDDCIVNKDTLKELLNTDRKLNGNYGFLSSKVLWRDGNICKMNIQKVSLINKVTDWDKEIQQIIMGTFVSFFIKKQIVQEIGLPISDFFIWADDIEYSRRVSLKYPSYLVNKSVVIHKSKNNIGSNIVEDSIDNLKRYSYAYRNESYVYKREGLFGVLYYKLKCFLHKIRIRKSNMSKKEKNKKLEVINNAIKEGKKFNPEIEYL